MWAGGDSVATTVTIEKLLKLIIIKRPSHRFAVLLKAQLNIIKVPLDIFYDLSVLSKIFLIFKWYPYYCQNKKCKYISIKV